MDNNERIAVALERIANHLDFFAEFVKKEMDEEEEKPKVIYKSYDQLDTFLIFDAQELTDLYSFVSDQCANYGFCSLAHVKEKFKRGHKIVFRDFDYGWKSTNELSMLFDAGETFKLDCKNLTRDTRGMK